MRNWHRRHRRARAIAAARPVRQCAGAPAPRCAPVNVPFKTHVALAERPEATVVAILIAASVCHGLNDTVQSLLPAIYPVLKEGFKLDFGEIGLITFVFQVTASLLQPFVGHFTVRRPQAYSLPVGMGFS